MIITISANPRPYSIYNKLKWMNGEYIKAMDFDKFYEMALAVSEADDSPGSGSEEDRRRW